MPGFSLAMDEEVYILAERLGYLLSVKGMQIATAESCTGGGVAQAITEVPGSSGWFDRSFVTYSNLAKKQMLDVSEQTLSEFGAVSDATVKEMLVGALQYSVADCAIAVSGIAGPGGGTPDKPVGTVYFGWTQKPDIIQTSRHLFSGNRHDVRAQAVVYALTMANQMLT
jgi:nicotinamide-nucleotide amidase